MGYGLFLPQLRAEFGFSTSTAGLVASAGFVAFLAALPVTAVMVHRIGPRIPVVLAGVSATAGFVLIATATDLAALTLGVIIAGTSAGLCWSPFNDAGERVAAPHERGTILSIIATGTAVGVALAGVLSLGVTRGLLPWPAAWWAFAVAAAAASLMAMAGVPGGDGRKPAVWPSFDGLIGGKALALHAIALVFGATNAIFISFTADRIVHAGGLPDLSPGDAPAVVFVSYGVVGLLGLLTGRLELRAGLEALIRTIFAAAALSMVLVAAAPTSWPGVVIASGLHGAALMAVSAVISFWSLRLFPGRGTLGFTTALISLAAGSVLGPAVAGFASELVGPAAMFMSAAAPSLLICLCPRPIVARSAERL
jgi:predicted MFS family arabinose efflux permease